MHNLPRVLVIGGSGFIGSYIVEECLRQRFHVAVLSRNRRDNTALSDNMEYIQGDIHALSVEDYISILKPFQKVVFAAGVDERVSPQGDAYAFYEKANIEPCRTLFTAMQTASKEQNGITHAVLLSSIFNGVHRQHPEMQLAQKHAYIRSRVNQNTLCQSLAQDHYILTTLEVPWVFGVPAHGASQWDALIRYARNGSPLLACRGGTNVIAVESLAEACVAALIKPTSSSALPVGDLNLSYEALLAHLCRFAGRNDANIRSNNDQFFLELMKAGGVFKNLLHIESGLDTKYIAELLLNDMAIDNSESVALLGYRTGIALQAMENTVKNCPESKLSTHWRNLLNAFRLHSSNRPS